MSDQYQSDYQYNQMSSPPPIQQTQPAPSKPMQRSKTVRNLGSAGSKVRGLFRKQQSKEKDDYRQSRQMSSHSDDHVLVDRPMSYPDLHMMERNFSSGSQRYSNLIQDIPNYNKNTNNTMTNSTTNTTLSSSTTASSMVSDAQPQPQPQQQPDVPPEAEDLRMQLEQLHLQILQARKNVQSEMEKREQLQSELDDARRQYQEKEQDYTQIEQSLFQLTRTVRATDDDLSTIRDSLKLLKYNVSRLILSLNKRADKDRAKAKFLARWPQLALVDDKGDLLEPSFVNLLTEKLIHDYLVQYVFQAPVYPGLEINDAYATLSQWFDQHDSGFSVRLRQQLAATIAKNTDTDLQSTIDTEKKRLSKLIYDELTDIYYPFLRENDAQVPEEKSYFAKVSDIVDKTFKLVVAIRGQEVVIHTLALEEGKQQLDEETMTDARGKTSGIVRFSVCPTFVGGDGDHGFLEKGKVVVI
ncbi:hypothetical protein DM01DRAFT_1336329 [Hesseltinella vesiculosa]|uniref:Uncharacterized protein n=1 Tax=Hesseltinella vesiculosa TaxID=101127 RepID=A0A1X2GG83_9FUNG|nr:hypothetical protein DM01DRAFT_1336329 [Hesseltinella vesiculosa]